MDKTRFLYPFDAKHPQIDLTRFYEWYYNILLNLQHYQNTQNVFLCFHLDNKKYLLKKYSKIHMDDWQRGKAEFKALNYLWNKEFKQIPQPIKFDENEGIGIYSYEQGRTLRIEEVDKEEISKIVDFLVKLHNLDNNDKEFFSPASSACLCLQDYIDVIEKRVNTLIEFEPKEEIEEKAKRFLDEKVLPKIEQTKKEFFKLVQERNLDLKKPLDISEQVLTPADFGFHNVLVDKEEYKFLDFEYFGRDDPARQILDFIYHAKTLELSEELKKYFFELYLEKRNLSDDFRKRLQLLSPLIAITWVLICLNILSKKQLEHIRFAHGDIKNIIEERLKNAEKMLEEIR